MYLCIRVCVCVCVYSEILFSHKHTHTHTGTLCSHKKERNPLWQCGWIWRRFAKWSKPGRERVLPLWEVKVSIFLPAGTASTGLAWRTRHDCSPAAQMRKDQVGDQVSEALITALRWALWGCLPGSFDSGVPQSCSSFSRKVRFPDTFYCLWISQTLRSTSDTVLCFLMLLSIYSPSIIFLAGSWI